MDAGRNEIAAFLQARGTGPEGFCKKVCLFFKRSRGHYRRLLVRDRIASHFDPALRMTSAGDQRKVWKHVADTLKLDGGTATKWTSGETDPPFEEIINYFDHSDCPFEGLPICDQSHTYPFAIARTLLYCQVYPWPRTPKILEVPLSIRRAWTIISNGKYYKRLHDINQYSLDLVISGLPELAAGVRDVGAIRQRMESRPSSDDPLFWPFAIFKFATFDRSSMKDEKKNTEDPLWYESSAQYPLEPKKCRAMMSAKA